MKKIKTLGVLACAAVMLFGSVSAHAAGYEVLMEPQIASVDGVIPGTVWIGGGERETYFFPTPFNKGFSVVHNNVCIMPGWEATYYDKGSYVVNAYGSKVDVGDYDCLGTYAFGFGSNPSENGDYWSEYQNPAFDPNLGVTAEGYIIAAKDGKGGIIDVQGNTVIPCEHDDLYELGIGFSTAASETESYQGKYYVPYYDPYIYDEYSHNYYNGLAVVREYQIDNSKVGIVDKNDNIIVPFVYEMITPCYDGICWVLKDGKWGTIAVDNQEISVSVDGSAVEFDQIPLIINGRTLAPLRAVFEKLGADVQWDGETQTITSTKGNTVISMTIDKNEMYKNGEMLELEEAPRIINERTLVPVRAIAEAFDCDVQWDGENSSVLINNK